MAPVPATTGPRGVSRLSLFVHTISQAILGSFQIIQKHHHGSKARAVAGQLFKAAQMLAFALSINVWQADIQPLQYATELTTVAGYVRQGWVSPTVYLALFYIAFSWVAVFVGLFCFAMYGFCMNSFPVLWPLRVLRSMGTLSASHLYIPLMYLLTSVFTCGMSEDNSSLWVDAGYTCYKGAHLAQVVLSVILSAALAGLACGFTLLVLDSNPASPSFSAKAHGRVDFVFLLCKTILVVVCEVFPHALGLWPTVIAVGIGASMWLGTTTTLLPFTNHRSNQIQLAFASANAWVALCLLIAAILGTGFDGAVILYMGMPLAAAAGVLLADRRASFIIRTPVAALRFGYEVDVKLRYMLHTAVWGHATDKLIPVGVDETKASVLLELQNSNLDDSDRREKIRALIPDKFYAETDVVIRAGVSKFPSSAILRIFASRYFAYYRNNRHMEMHHLLAAERDSGFLDIAFFAFLAQQAQSYGNAKQTISAISRVAFEKHLGIARRQTASSLQAQARFWGLLAEPTPDISLLMGVTVEMNKAMNDAERAFVEMLHLNAQSVTGLRLYADFTLNVIGNEVKAAVLTAEADRIEDSRMKDEATAGATDLRIMSASDQALVPDNAAVITVSSAHGSLGIITNANNAAGKLFGYPRWQLERRNISMLMPNVISQHHQGFMECYMKSGEGVVVDTTRVVMGQHHSGAIFPLLITVREASAVEGSASFVGVMRAYQLPQEIILLNSDFTVCAASAASLSLLGIDADTLGAAGGTKRRPLDTHAPEAAAVAPNHVSEWVEEWKAELPQLSAGEEVSLLVKSAQAPPDSPSTFTSAASSSRKKRTGAAGAYGKRRGSNASIGITEPTWVLGQLQPLDIGASGVEGKVKCRLYVLYWRYMSKDNHTVNRAAARRRSSLMAAGFPVGAVAAASGDGKGAGKHHKEGKSATVAAHPDDPDVTEHKHKHGSEAGGVQRPPALHHIPLFGSPDGTGGGGACPFLNKRTAAAAVSAATGVHSGAGTPKPNVSLPGAVEGHDAAALPRSTPRFHAHMSASAKSDMTEGSTDSLCALLALPPKKGGDTALSGGGGDPTASIGKSTPIATTTAGKTHSRRSSGASRNDVEDSAIVGGGSELVSILTGGKNGSNSKNRHLERRVVLHSYQSDGSAASDKPVAGARSGGASPSKSDDEDSVRAPVRRAGGAHTPPPRGRQQHFDDEGSSSFQGWSAELGSPGPSGSLEKIGGKQRDSSGGSGIIGSKNHAMDGRTSSWDQQAALYVDARKPEDKSVNADHEGPHAEVRVRGDGASSNGSAKRKSTRKLQDRLRRIVLGTSHRILPGLVLLRVVTFLVLLACILLAASTTVVESAGLQKFQLEMATTLSASAVTMRLVISLFFLQQMMLYNIGLPVSPAALEQTRAQLEDSSTIFGQLFRNSVQQAGQAGEDGIFYDPVLTVQIGINSDGTPSYDTVSLLEASSLVEVAAHNIAALNVSQVTMKNPSVQILSNNVQPGATLHDSIYDASKTFYTMAQSDAMDLLHTSSITFIAAAISIVGVSFVLVPFLVRIDNQRDRYILPFLSLPLAVVERLRDIANRKAVQSRCASGDMEEEDDGESQDDEENQLFGRNNNNERGGGDDESGGASSDDDEEDWRYLLQAAAVKAKITAINVGSNGRSFYGRLSRANSERDMGASAGAGSLGGSFFGSIQRLISTERGGPNAEGAAQAAVVEEARAKALADPAYKAGVASGRIIPRYRFPQRAHRKSGYSLLHLTLRFVLPLLSLLGFFGTKYAVTVNSLNASVLSASVAVIASLRAVEARELLNSITSTFLAPGNPNDWAVANLTASASMLSQEVEWHNAMLIFGEPPGQPDPMNDPAMYTIFGTANRAMDNTAALGAGQLARIRSGYYGDGCAFLASSDPSVFQYTSAPFNYSACTQFMAGAVSHGIYGAFETFHSQAESTIALRSEITLSANLTGVNPDNATAFSVVDMFSSPSSLNFFALTIDYLQPAFSDIALRYTNEGQSLIAVLQTFQATFTAVFLVIFVTFYALLYLPQTVAVSQEIKEQRVWLMLLPADVIDGIDGLGRQIKDELAWEESDSVMALEGATGAFDGMGGE